jgi:hypothetical protein
MTERPVADRLGPAAVPRAVEARIIQGSLARITAPRLRRPWFLVTTTALTATALGLFLLLRPLPLAPGPPPGSPPAPVTATAPATPPPTAPRPLPLPSLVGPRTLDLGRHRMRLAAGGRATPLPAAPGAIKLRLDGGRARFDVARRERAEPFEVLAGPVLVSVVGTRFAVGVGDDPRCSAVAVEEGEVAVSFRGRTVARLRPSDERTFCLSAVGLETSAPGEPWVHRALALVAEGRQLDRAAALLERYRRTQPLGVLEDEVLFHLVRLRARLGQRPQAEALLHELETRYPGDERLAGLRGIVRPR